MTVFFCGALFTTQHTHVHIVIIPYEREMWHMLLLPLNASVRTQQKIQNLNIITICPQQL